MTNDKLVCAVCEQEFKKWWTTTRGQTRSGWPALQDHMVDNHPAEAEEMGLLKERETPDEETPWDPEEDNHESDGNRQGWEMMQFYSD